jgi:hypothetical protein
LLYPDGRMPPLPASDNVFTFTHIQMKALHSHLVAVGV